MCAFVIGKANVISKEQDIDLRLMFHKYSRLLVDGGAVKYQM